MEVARIVYRLIGMSEELNIKPLSEIASYAMYMLGSDMTDDQWEELKERSHIEQIQYFYCHSDCQDFADVLSRVTGWPTVVLSHKTHGPVHYMNKMPDGKLVDAIGVWTVEQIPKRYGLKKLMISEISFKDDHECFRGDDDDEDPFSYAISAIRQFIHEPYGTPEFQQISCKIIPELDCVISPSF